MPGRLANEARRLLFLLIVAVLAGTAQTGAGAQEPTSNPVSVPTAAMALLNATIPALDEPLRCPVDTELGKKCLLYHVGLPAID